MMTATTLPSASSRCAVSSDSLTRSTFWATCVDRLPDVERVAAHDEPRGEAVLVDERDAGLRVRVAGDRPTSAAITSGIGEKHAEQHGRAAQRAQVLPEQESHRLHVQRAVDELERAVGVARELVRVVGRDQDAAAALADAPRDLPQPAALGRVERGRRLVEQQHPRRAEQRQGDVEPLAVADAHTRPHAGRRGARTRRATRSTRPAVGAFERARTGGDTRAP